MIKFKDLSPIANEIYEQLKPIAAKDLAEVLAQKFDDYRVVFGDVYFSNGKSITGHYWLCHEDGLTLDPIRKIEFADCTEAYPCNRAMAPIACANGFDCKLINDFEGFKYPSLSKCMDGQKQWQLGEARR